MTIAWWIYDSLNSKDYCIQKLRLSLDFWIASKTVGFQNDKKTIAFPKVHITYRFWWSKMISIFHNPEMNFAFHQSQLIKGSTKHNCLLGSKNLGTIWIPPGADEKWIPARPHDCWIQLCLRDHASSQSFSIWYTILCLRIITLNNIL